MEKSMLHNLDTRLLKQRTQEARSFTVLIPGKDDLRMARGKLYPGNAP
jgi:hypothetical protein